jgi:hypothetical protein
MNHKTILANVIRANKTNKKCWKKVYSIFKINLLGLTNHKTILANVIRANKTNKNRV